jgi:hypothetical protein
VANLRQFAAADRAVTSMLGWFVERRVQQFLTACAASDHIDTVSPSLFDFQQTRQGLFDGVFLYPLCAFLKAKLGSGATPSGPRPLGSAPLGRRGNADDAVTNLQARAIKLTSKDVWQVFLDHAHKAPVPHLCCRFHLNGRCVRSCHYADTHVALSSDQKSVLTTAWIGKCRARMNATANSTDRGCKKSKLVANRESYLAAAVDVAAPLDIIAASLSLASPPAWGPSPISLAPPRPRATASALALTRSAAARLHDTWTTDAWALGLIQYPPSAQHPTTPLDTHNCKCHHSPPSPSHRSPPQTPVPFPRLSFASTSFPTLPDGRLHEFVTAILSTSPPLTSPTEFMFAWTPSAAAHNLAVLRRYDMRLGAAIAAQPFSTLSPGSEFRSAELLAPLLSCHPPGSLFQA